MAAEHQEKSLDLYSAFIARREKVYIWTNVVDTLLGVARNVIAYVYLINLALGEGRATLNGVDIRRFNRCEYYKLFSAVCCDRKGALACRLTLASFSATLNPKLNCNSNTVLNCVLACEEVVDIEE